MELKILQEIDSEVREINKILADSQVEVHATLTEKLIEFNVELHKEIKDALYHQYLKEKKI